MNIEKCREDGKKGGQIIRDRAVADYYKNPKVCKTCGNTIHLEDGVRPSQTKKKHFCNRSCAATYNNKHSPKRKGISSGMCARCGRTLLFKRRPKGGYLQRKYCDPCLKKARVEQGNANAWHNFPPIPVEEQSKAEVKRRNHNTRLWWGNRITKHARKVYQESGKPYTCRQCGYSLHVDICHVKDIKDFPDTALVKEMNHPDNLVALCKNHHWEFDNGFLKL